MAEPKARSAADVEADREDGNDESVHEHAPSARLSATAENAPTERSVQNEGHERKRWRPPRAHDATHHWCARRGEEVEYEEEDARKRACPPRAQLYIQKTAAPQLYRSDCSGGSETNASAHECLRGTCAQACAHRHRVAIHVFGMWYTFQRPAWRV